MATQRGNQGDSKSGGAKKNPGNFANDPERARKAGSKGGQSRGTGNGSRGASTRDGDSVKAHTSEGDSDAGEELRGMTEDGEEVVATLDDDAGDSSGERGGSGNFANDRKRASEAGRKGGKH